ncbi:MAG: S-adenosylmethionine:tRNA ribosyltransferase-isomerase, partial [Muribaculaceae bacterium]|nr:S-adenosylmethionine:tRNA ribosyltransferase-isomerase [Muribaculaceae bacterium]
MKLSQFNFQLPDAHIAMHPSENRDECRLMVVDVRDGSIKHCIFKEIINFFEDQDVIVFNDTRVFPARLFCNKEKTNAKIEVFL